VVLLFPSVIVVGNVGDSRAVLCCDRIDSLDHGVRGNLVALPLTEDHTPYNPAERTRIEALGGAVVNTGEKLRVNGAIAVTRSIGDFPFGPLLTADPDIFLFNRFELGSADDNVGEGSGASVEKNACEVLHDLRTGVSPGSRRGVAAQQFIVLASDGLFDVMTNDEVVLFVCDSLVEIIQTMPSSQSQSEAAAGGDISVADRRELPIDAFHVAAEHLAQEAYVRGSSDNIGVCIINLLTH
jgi:serine/threonine protein phosphatase PrpC